MSLARTALLVALGGLFAGSVGTASADDMPRIEPLDTCFVQPDAALTPGVTYRCGHVVVPEDVLRPAGRVVRLGYMRVSNGSGGSGPPLIMLAGGPGSSLIQPAMFYLFSEQFLGPLLAGRDIIVLEQRGARYSDPHLDCPETAAFAWTAAEQGLDPQAATDLRRQAIPVCARRVAAQGIDLAQYNVQAIVGDIEAARQAFGFDHISLYGASYGAQIAQQMLRMHPDRLEAVVLDGANALSPTSWVQDRARDADDALNRLHDICEADARCAAAYDLRGMADEAMAIFDAGPIEGSLPDPVDPSRSLAFQVTAGDFANLIFDFQTGQTSIRSLPAMMSSFLADGRKSMQSALGEIFGSALLAARDPAPQDIAPLAHAAIICTDDPVTDPGDVTILPEASAFARAYARSMYDLYQGFCSDLALPVLPAAFDEDAISDVPTLILAGALDARTPLFRSEEVAAKLPRATLAVFPEGTHVQLGEVNTCAASLMVSFILDPDARLDQGCIGAAPKLGFVLPNGSMSHESDQ